MTDRRVPPGFVSLPGFVLLPGLVFLVAVGALARAVGAVAPLHPLLAAVVLGAVVANVVGVPSVFEPGVRTYDRLLEAGIVLMGVRISLDSVLAAGVPLALAVVGVVALSLVVAETCSRYLLGLDRRLGSLVAAGASVCGVSAVVAVAGSVRADEDHVVYATSAILLFDALTLFAFPAVGHALGLSDRAFGVWAGLSMFSTGPVTAAGFAYSEVAGQWATVTKLTRNALLGALVVVYSFAYADSPASVDAGESVESVRTTATLRRVWDGFPTFVLGFVAMVVLTAAGTFTPSQVAVVESAYDWLFLVAFAGLGTTIAVEDLRNAGTGPVALLALTLLLVGAVSLVVARVGF
ncbi:MULTISPECIES: YeiH family protein [Halorussus]|uniref:YeiH family protein n=1 Tax=Halorussus TaxID=1070314 RepID=UPI00209CECAA|nr:putative sulfate exporter family transporter [Halorussus vallis]USZ76414.1 YeiH family protein [Halorussus vallis]